MQHYRDLAIAFTEHDRNMQTNQSAQALLGVRDGLGRIEHARLSDVHGVVHQAEKDLVLALEMVVEPALAEFEGGCNVVHGRGVVPLQLEQASRRPQNFLARIRVFAGHRDQYTREKAPRTSNAGSVRHCEIVSCGEALASVAL